ncbi:hypothetical protein D0869_09762 [Hortaea werneckii]|uniref:Zn(2)-C6 fungal-type domain-containing protein n=1 Tax=Hortaea werneckii TaxID=91943 RepID=A0A3M6WGJ1_HORWE|nr:hypothetical protein D0869_09762 [Hortaea werneckii]
MNPDMMMTQSYHGFGEYDSHYQSSQHRSTSTPGYYDRLTPYSSVGHYANYDNARHELRPGCGGRSVTRQIHEPEPEIAPGTARRRISVACSRCRRRKIKCSGNPGDGTGCQACRASGADVSLCHFNRVNSHELSMTGVEVYPPGSIAGNTPHSAGYASDTGSANGTGWMGTHHQPMQRPSLPTLHTRSSFVDGYDQYETSPVDSYTHASSSMPRQDSYSSSYPGYENYRAWSTSSAMMPTPASGGYHEQPSSYSFGNLTAPFPQHSGSRLPSVTSDTFGSMNMSSLHSSLPVHTAQERRLPAPYTITYPNAQTQHPSTQQLPDIRTIGSISSEPRVHIHGIHSRNAMPWSSEATPMSATTASNSNVPPTTGVPGLTTAFQSQSRAQYPHHGHQDQPQNAVGVSEPAFGYQFPMVQTNCPRPVSPNVSPASASGPPGCESFPSTASNSSSTTSMQIPCSSSLSHAQPSHLQLESRSQHHRDLPALHLETPEGPHQSAEPPIHPSLFSPSHTDAVPPASLYSFSTDSGNGISTFLPTSATADRPSTASGDNDQGSSSMSAPTTYNSAPALRHSHPHHRGKHSANPEVLRSQSSFERQRAQTAQRMSVHSLNARY